MNGIDENLNNSEYVARRQNEVCRSERYFETRRAARRFRSYIKLTLKKTQRVYKCRSCGGFHLATKK